MVARYTSKDIQIIFIGMSFIGNNSKIPKTFTSNIIRHLQKRIITVFFFSRMAVYEFKIKSVVHISTQVLLEQCERMKVYF